MLLRKGGICSGKCKVVDIVCVVLYGLNYKIIKMIKINKILKLSKSLKVVKLLKLLTILDFSKTNILQLV